MCSDEFSIKHALPCDVFSSSSEVSKVLNLDISLKTIEIIIRRLRSSELTLSVAQPRRTRNV